MKLYYHGSVRNGKLILPKRMRIEIADVFNEKSIKVTVERNKAKRSDAQNRYYWAVVLPYVRDGFIDIGNELQRNGESIMLIHELMKERFLDNGIELADGYGEVMKTKPTTTSLTKDEMTDYIESIRRWAAEFLNVQIPDANE